MILDSGLVFWATLYVTTWRDTHIASIVTSVSCASCMSRRVCSNIADDDEAVVFACSLLCSGFASISVTASGKVSWTCPPQFTLWWRLWTCVGRVAPVALVVTSVSSCAVSRFSLYCPTSATQHVTTFSCTKMHRLDSVVVSWHYATSGI